MSETLAVLCVINDTVVEETHTGDRVTYQHYENGRAIVKIWTDASVTETISYQRAERIHRTHHREQP